MSELYLPDYYEKVKQVRQLEDSNEWLQTQLEESEALIGRLMIANQKLRKEIAALKGEA